MFKANLNEILRRRYKWKEQERELSNIKIVNKAREKVIKLFDWYSTIASETIQKQIQGERIEILTPKQMLHQRIPIALREVKACIISEIFLYEISQIIFFLIQAEVNTAITSNPHRLSLNFTDKKI